MATKFSDLPDEVRRLYHNKVVAPDPFTSISNMLIWHEEMRRDNPTEFAQLDSEAKQTMGLFRNFFFMPQNIAKAKVVYVDKDLIPSITSTDNNIFNRNTGLPVMFINQDFQYGDNLIKGILIANAKELTDNMDPGMRMKLIIENKDMDLFKALLFMWVYIDYDDGTETWMSFTTNDLKKYPDRERQRLCNYVGSVACNIIDLMNHDVENIDINVIDTTREENIKRVRNGKVPVSRKVYIRPKSEVRNYYINFNRELRECGRITHKFLVRGHWRHFRSSKWKLAQGKSTWVKPYIKGKGIFVEKTYKLEGGNNELSRM